jgi:hypothetical protein
MVCCQCGGKARALYRGRCGGCHRLLDLSAARVDLSGAGASRLTFRQAQPIVAAIVADLGESEKLRLLDFIRLRW